MPVGTLTEAPHSEFAAEGAPGDVAVCHCGDCVAETDAMGAGDERLVGTPCEANACAATPTGISLASLNPIGPLFTVASLPASAIGCVANGCVSSACEGPPDLPPPSRFFPVPTQPVFAPRQPDGYTIPSHL